VDERATAVNQETTTKPPTLIIMGVGNGSGNHFVEGNSESIGILQTKLFKLERFERALRLIAYNLDVAPRKAAQIALEENP
jgi:hypothetical protein